MTVRMHQMDLFSTSEFEVLNDEIDKLKKACDNIRRGLFARHHELERQLIEMHAEIASLREMVLPHSSKTIPLHRSMG